MTCAVCRIRNGEQLPLCRLCAKSLDRVPHTNLDIVLWAARRARYFAARCKGAK